jgi:hypothetical protein
MNLVPKKAKFNRYKIGTHQFTLEFFSRALFNGLFIGSIVVVRGIRLALCTTLWLRISDADFIVRGLGAPSSSPGVRVFDVNGHVDQCTTTVLTQLANVHNFNASLSNIVRLFVFQGARDLQIAT